MDVEELRKFCLALPGVEEDVKWGNDLCFCVGKKMFCVTGFNSPITASLKAPDEEFEGLCERKGIIPAPYLARYKWIYVKEPHAFSKKEWEHYIKTSYELIKAKLPAKIRKSIG